MAVSSCRGRDLHNAFQRNRCLERFYHPSLLLLFLLLFSGHHYGYLLEVHTGES
jgi:hypothetical protein